MNTTIHPAFDCVTSSPAMIYIMETGFIPKNLMTREIARYVTDAEYAEYAADATTMTIDRVSTITGNDTLLFAAHAGTGPCIMTFKKNVDIVCSMGQGILKWADGCEVAGTPVVDFDYQDEAFDRDLAACVAFMLTHNK